MGGGGYNGENGSSVRLLTFAVLCWHPRVSARGVAIRVSSTAEVRRSGVEVFTPKPVGARIKRREDERLLTGRSAYVDDDTPTSQPAPRDVSPQPVRARADQPNRRGPGAGDGGRGRGADRPANCGTRQTGARHVPNAGISGDRLPAPRRARSIWPRTRTWKRRASVWHTWRIFPPLTPIVRPWESHRPGSSREPDQGVGAVGDDRHDLPDVVGFAQRVRGAQAFEFFAGRGIAHREAAE